MRFAELLESAGLAPPSAGAEISDVQIDSRRCGEGSCFVAVRGWTRDGHRYIPDALKAGASAVVVEDPAAACDAPAMAVTGSTKAAAGRLAQAIRGWPARKLTCVGITGTNGKTTVAHLVRGVLRRAGREPAMLGTIHYETGADVRAAPTTTPDPISLAEMTNEMVAAGKTHLVMEVSSHALDQRRTSGLSFRVGVFTNLSGDHLDYHGDLDRYLAAKCLLFEQLDANAWAVVNADDPAGRRILDATQAQQLRYALDAEAELVGRVLRSDTDGCEFELTTPRGDVRARTPLIGRHNVQNCLAAAGACVALGVELPTIAAGLAEVSRVAGRLQRVPCKKRFDVFVDYAHTDDALANVLRSLRPLTRGRLTVVFGCGGDRDRTKRPRMAAVAQDLADRLVVTSDNPRGEKPEAILDEILAGLGAEGRRRTQVEPDRRAAIDLALSEAREGDVVLIAGKGHETYQIIGERRMDFDDAAIARELLAAKGSVA
jgi:UDP-N-acetylmuramoyl-L-alanyl-D-glutamate--2,6-diaminopimelate ligase